MLKYMLFALTLIHFSLFANASQIEELERQMWTDIKTRNWPAIENRIAPFFQSIHSDGARTKAQEIALIKNLNVKGDFTISDLKITEGQHVVVITYFISVNEAIDKTPLSTKPNPRLSVWQNINGNWQWVAHANLDLINAK